MLSIYVYLHIYIYLQVSNVCQTLPIYMCVLVREVCCLTFGVCVRRTCRVTSGASVCGSELENWKKRESFVA